MLRHFVLPQVGLAVLVLAVPGVAISAPTIVYDNTTTLVTGDFIPFGLPEGFWPFNQFGEDPIGDQVGLAGTNRAVTRVELILSSSTRTVLTEVKLTLYKNDGEDAFGVPGAPGTVLGTKTLTDVVVDGPTVVPFDLSEVVVVPDVFSWTAAADSDVAGPATYDPPTVGYAPMWGPFQHAWDFGVADGEWYAFYFEDNPVANFGARVWAVPEPACLALFTASALVALGRRRR